MPTESLDDRPRAGRRQLAGVVAGLLVLAVVAALPCGQVREVGGAARALVLPPEPGRAEPPTWLLPSVTVRPRTLAEWAFGGIRHLAQAPSADDPGASAWATAAAVSGPWLRVDAVRAGSPAARAGLQPGDVVTAAGRGRASLGAIDTALAVGEPVVLRVLRSGRVADVTVYPRPPWPQPRAGGITISPWFDSVPDRPPIGTGRARGSSAGLVLALADVDLLTPGDLTGGHAVAATGTVGPGGQVGRVLGLERKTEAAVAAGARVFLVPADDARTVRAVAAGRLDVIGVRSVAEAVAALCARGGRSSACSAQAVPVR